MELIILFVDFIVLNVLLFPAAMTFILYSHLKKKGKIQKNISLTIFILVTAIMLYLWLKLVFGPSGFGPEYETAVIKQKIGGELVCHSVFTADIHSWIYDVEYQYVNTYGDTIDLGKGGYYGREWYKNEQLRKYNDWLLLKTGNRKHSERLIMKNIRTDSIKIYNFTDEFIVNDSLWKTKNIKVLLNYCCSETSIQSIQENRVILKFRYRTDKNDLGVAQQKITYEINNETGEMKMTNIQDISFKKKYYKK